MAGVTVAFDTLKAATRLREEAGFDETKARVLVSTFAEGMVENLATKDDIAGLRREIATLATKEELAALRGEMHEMGAGLRGEMHEMGARLHGEMHADGCPRCTARSQTDPAMVRCTRSRPPCAVR